MTKPYRDIRGNWAAESNYGTEDGRAIEILTMKVSDGSLKTTVKVGKRNDWALEYTPYEDYYECTRVSRHGRITANIVANQHGETIAKINELKLKINDHYAKKLLTV